MSDYTFSFTYRFKRGDTCNYCGTVFGYKLERSATAACDGGLLGRESKIYLKLSGTALKEMRKGVAEETENKACPKCGRLPSEAYSNVFNAKRVDEALLTAFIGGFFAFLGLGLLNEALDGALDGWFWEFFWGGVATTAAYLATSRARAFRRFFGDPAPNVASSGAKVWGVREECAKFTELKGRRDFKRLATSEIALLGAVAAFALAAGGRLIPESIFVFTCAGAALVGFAWLGILALRSRRLKQPEIQFQGEKHFACGWEWREAFETKARSVLRKAPDIEAILAQAPKLEAFLAAESARTVEILRSASELTAEGAEALRIAEAETTQTTEDKATRRTAQTAEDKATRRTAQVAESEAVGATRKKAVATTVAEEDEVAASAKRLSRYDR